MYLLSRRAMMCPPNAVFCWLPGVTCVCLCAFMEKIRPWASYLTSELQLPSTKMKMIRVPDVINIKC